MTLLLILAVCFLAYTNGANDNFKGVASLFGSQTTSYRVAITLATACTFAGSVAAIFLAQTLLTRFSGKGLVPDSLVGSGYFLLAVALGAGITVLLATLKGFPISTTHALIGAMVGSGGMAVGSQVNLLILGKAFFLPLLLSPVLAIVLGAMLYLIFSFLRSWLGITKEWCLCVGNEQQVISIPQPASVFAIQDPAPILTATSGEQSECEQRYAGVFFGIRYQQIMDAAHFLSAGIVSFARGLNDTPKIAALLMLVQSLEARQCLIIVAVAIAIGGLLGARQVAETMSHKITDINHGQGFTANFTTGLLVILASLTGLPVSTTQVAVGALFGIGLTSRRANVNMMRNILLSWLITLPFAAVIGALVYWLSQTLYVVS